MGTDPSEVSFLIAGNKKGGWKRPLFFIFSPYFSVLLRTHPYPSVPIRTSPYPSVLLRTHPYLHSIGTGTQKKIRNHKSSHSLHNRHDTGNKTGVMPSVDLHIHFLPFYIDAFL